MLLKLWLLLFVGALKSAASVCRGANIGKFKIHKYRDLDRGTEFVLEPFQDTSNFIMTSQRSGLKLGDYVLIQEDSKACKYQILEIEYYSDSPTDLWMAKLMPAGGLVSLSH